MKYHPLTEDLKKMTRGHYITETYGYNKFFDTCDQIIREWLDEKADILKKYDAINNITGQKTTDREVDKVLELKKEQTLEEKFEEAMFHAGTSYSYATLAKIAEEHYKEKP